MHERHQAKQLAISAVAAQCPGDWQTAAGPQDAYANIDGRSVALDIAIMTPALRARPSSEFRLRQDVVARRVLRDVEFALNPRVPNRKCIILTLGAPIKLPAQLIAALIRLLADYIEGGRQERDESRTVLGNRVRFRVLKREQWCNAKLIGFVFSGDPKPAALATALHSLHENIAATGKRRTPVGFAGDRWLILSSAAWLADVDTYRRLMTLVSRQHPFKRILMLSHGGRAATLADLAGDGR